MPEDTQVQAAVVQLRFANVESVIRVAETLKYWLGLPLPEAVIEDPTHSDKFVVLADLEKVFSKCVESYQSKLSPDKGLDAGPEFGRNGAIIGS